ncbi:unnamed protein product [Eruca vesicaria subsp. sativa]|uniref:Uncharacterized protein n=1 Tax=Eruca vesicaria subsp. sativa TaxID=29727 RepID=A0ABC8LXD4_ERUVS|nr:unnamed protein product [Eruca vesicaria subsp. sativa]
MKNRFNIVLTEKSFIFKSEPITNCYHYAFKSINAVLRGLAHPMSYIYVYGALVGVGELEFRELHGGGEWASDMDERIVFTLINPELPAIAF